MVNLIGGRYHLLGTLPSSGGFSEVYRAFDRLSGEYVALKKMRIPQRDFVNTPEDSLALAQEFRLLSSLRHPHIIEVLDYGFIPDYDAQHQPVFYPFLTMPFLDDSPTIIQAASTRSTSDKLRWLIQLLQALSYLHGRGVVHRDLKPRNILVHGDNIKIVDFGLAMAEQSAVTLDARASTGGTLAYMAPEILEDNLASPSSDLYAVGMVAYELLTGSYPFEQINLNRLLHSIMTQMPEWSPIEPRYVPILQRLLEKNPQRRYHSADEVIVALSQADQQPIPIETNIIRESLLQASRFVGRKTELMLLTGVMEEIMNGQTNRAEMWLVAGESGVGKSRLIDEIIVRALMRGMLVLRGQGVAGSSLPYQLWRDPARRLLLTSEAPDPEIAVFKPLVADVERLLDRTIPDFPVQVTPYYLAMMMLRLMRAYVDSSDGHQRALPRGILLVLEDLHWLEDSPESIELLNALLMHASDLRLFIVGAFRDDEAPLLPQQIPLATTFKLGRLDDDAIRELSRSILGEAGADDWLIHYLRQQTEGNVLFMVEALRALADEVGQLSAVREGVRSAAALSGGVQQLLRRRLNRVPRWGYALLQLAAISGRKIDLPIMRALVDWLYDDGRNPLMSNKITLSDWLTACANAAVLEFNEGNWRFVHDKLRETILEDIPGNLLPTLHRRLAQTIETAHADLTQWAPLLLDHWLHGNQPDRAYPYALLTIEQEMAVSNYRDVRWIIVSLLAHPLSDMQRFELYWRLGQALYYQSDFTEAAEAYQRSLELATQREAPEGMARALTGLGYVMLERGDYPRAQYYYRAALERTPPHSAARIEALLGLGTTALRQGDLEIAEDFYQECLTITPETNAMTNLSAALHHLGDIAFMRGDLVQAAAYFQSGLELRERAGNRFGMALSLNNLGVIALRQGDIEMAGAYFRRSLAIREEIGDRQGIGTSLISLGEVALLSGQWDEAEHSLRRSLELWQELGNRQKTARALTVLGEAAHARRDYPAALEFYRQAYEIYVMIGDRPGLAETSVRRSPAALAAGDREGARMALIEGLAIAQGMHLSPEVLRGLLAYVLLLLADGTPQLASDLLAVVEQHPAADHRARQLALALRKAYGNQLPAPIRATLDLDALVPGVLVDLQASVG